MQKQTKSLSPSFRILRLLLSKTPSNLIAAIATIPPPTTIHALRFSNLPKAPFAALVDIGVGAFVVEVDPCILVVTFQPGIAVASVGLVVGDPEVGCAKA